MKKILMLFLLISTKCVFSQTSRELLQLKLSTMHSMSADFQQVVKAGDSIISRSSGTMALERPGHFRWHTQKPMQQLVVTDGQNIWVYDVELEQVAVKKQQKGLGVTAALFLSNYDKEALSREFMVSQSSVAADSAFILKARSPKANFQVIRLKFHQQYLSTLQLDDQLGQTTLVRFSNIKLNPRLPAAFFQFKPPKGVDVVEQ